MTYNYDRFEGLFIPTVTPFLADLTVDTASLDRLARHQASIPGVAGLVSCARIGEGTVLAPDEKLAVYEAMGSAARACGKLHIATIAPQSTAEAIAIIKKLESLPVDAVMIFPPLLFAWGKVSGDLKVRFFEDIARATKLPVVLFQIPVQSYWYDADTVDRIAALPNVVAFKEASFNLELFTSICRKLQASGRRMRVMTGNDRFVGKSYELGAVGSLIGMANLAPEQWAMLDAAGRAGDFAGAIALQHKLAELSEVVFGEPIVEAVGRIKAILHDEGLIAHAGVRPPQMGITSEERRTVIESFRRVRSAQDVKMVVTEAAAAD
jgi:dihydrodipicolinate synthase/N-acetylneuraminate lyase